MRIFCEPHRDLRSVLTIFLDNEPWRNIHTTIFGRRPLLPESCLSEQEFRAQFFVFEHRYAKNYALRRLSLQAMLSQALARSLKERLVSEKTIVLVLGELKALGLINDEEWTASFVRGLERKKMGPRAIAQKLASKGIKREGIELALEHSKGSTDQEASVLALLGSRYAKKNLSDFREKQKVTASLMRRGFDLTIILKCLDKKY